MIVIFSKKTCNHENLLFIFAPLKCGSSSVGRAPAFQAGCREFEPRLPLFKAETLFRLFYFTKLKSLPLSNSSGAWFCLKRRALRFPFSVIMSPLISNQLPSRNPKTGIELKV